MAQFFPVSTCGIIFMRFGLPLPGTIHLVKGREIYTSHPKLHNQSDLTICIKIDINLKKKWYSSFQLQEYVSTLNDFNFPL